MKRIAVNRYWLLKKVRPVLLAIILLPLSSCRDRKQENPAATAGPRTFTTPLGKEFQLPEPSEKMLDLYQTAKVTYGSNPEDIDALIWYGRRTAYLGEYERAIAIYSEGIKKFPKNARLYRHRGHRYISLRHFDKAIADLEKASRLIRGTENEIEPDGLPNALNIPVSTLHGNIWYHLGLAYYLKHDYQKALAAYQKCREVGDNDDNLVSSTHWLYMIQRRLGNPERADTQLDSITANLKIIENHSYYTLCKFYKDMLPIDSLQTVKIGSPSADAIVYGLANWYFYNDDKERSEALMERLVESTSWSSFGYIAAETDLLHYFEKTH
ncbi:tetratricopeptide repeat protein [Flavobacteriaceae bacterium TP-CH-4]|uniref:Tetratricopeptide repeat protein n=1 Tax=Pelagihabitans pacificus TaxID=2696054 RepID=A0A967AV94_9FLAO|nr:tetratricopeptide repeat protein [Pelagihabitans pacificus]NHF60863.1 tetratricopeptide repeat protein [Pelagihabitans pacificus]